MSAPNQAFKSPVRGSIPGKRWLPVVLLLTLGVSLLLSIPHVQVRTKHFAVLDRGFSIPISTDNDLEARILILQQVYAPRLNYYQRLKHKDEDDLYLASIQSHAKYARTWGHGYKFDSQIWLDGDSRRSKHLNKVYALLNTILEEIAKGDQGAEWIFFTDADTLILHPSISITTLLPSSPAPLILANTDHRGFNAGVMTFRVDPLLAHFLISMIATETHIYSTTGLHATDQHLWGTTIQLPQHQDVADRWYTIPQDWINSYWADPGVRLQIHLVHQRKWQEEWRETVLARADDEYLQAEESGLGLRQALRSTPLWTEARDTAATFWKDAKGGIDGVLFNEI